MEKLHADVLELAGNKKFYGQLISITEKIITVNILTEEDASIQPVSLPRDKVIKITDESGTVLFSDNTQHIIVLKRYYDEIRNNWEELKDRFNSKHNTIRFITGKKKGGKIINITKQFVFLENGSNDLMENSKLSVEKFSLNKIAKIGDKHVLFIDPQKPRLRRSKEIKYPVYSVSVGVVYAQTNYDQLQQLFQEFYDNSGLSFSAEKRAAGFPGIQMKFDAFIKPYLSLGLTGYYYKKENLNTIGMAIADVKYIFYQTALKPWLSIGFAGHDFRSSEKVQQTNYIWDTSKGTASFGLGIDFGDELGTGYNLSIHYLPFGKGTTKIKDPDISVKKKLDFTMFLISVGMRFNFN